MAIVRACDIFLEDATARNLREPTLYKYRLLFRRLQEFIQGNGESNNLVRQLRPDRRGAISARLVNRNIAARKKLEALRTFMRFCWE